jgi:hypothetical protein
VSQRYKIRRTNFCGTARPLGTIRHVDGMQTEDVLVSGFSGKGNQIDGPGIWIDHGSSRDSEFGNHAAPDFGLGNGGHAVGCIEKANLPQRLGTGCVGIEGVETVVRGSHKQSVVKSIPRDLDSRQVQGLRVYSAVYRKEGTLFEQSGFQTRRC